MVLPSIEATQLALAHHAYVADVGLATSLFLALRMGKALLLEGEPGVGKTEVAKVLSQMFDAPLKRRCVYHWIDYPSREKEIEIVRRKAPGISERLAAQVVDFVQAARRQDLTKNPGVAETLDWVEALAHLSVSELSREVVEATLGIILKYQDDVDRLRGPLVGTLLEQGGGRGG